MTPSEFKISKFAKLWMSFEKKILQKNPTILNFSHKNSFLWIKKDFLNLKYSDRSELDIFDETIIVKNFHFSQKLG